MSIYWHKITLHLLRWSLISFIRALSFKSSPIQILQIFCGDVSAFFFFFCYYCTTCTMLMLTKRCWRSCINFRHRRLQNKEILLKNLGIKKSLQIIQGLIFHEGFFFFFFALYLLLEVGISVETIANNILDHKHDIYRTVKLFIRITN